MLCWKIFQNRALCPRCASEMWNLVEFGACLLGGCECKAWGGLQACREGFHSAPCQAALSGTLGDGSPGWTQGGELSEVFPGLAWQRLPCNPFCLLCRSHNQHRHLQCLGKLGFPACLLPALRLWPPSLQLMWSLNVHLPPWASPFMLFGEVHVQLWICM